MVMLYTLNLEIKVLAVAGLTVLFSWVILLCLVSCLQRVQREGGGGRDGNTMYEFMLLELRYPLTGDVSRFLNLLNYHPSFPT